MKPRLYSSALLMALIIIGAFFVPALGGERNCKPAWKCASPAPTATASPPASSAPTTAPTAVPTNLRWGLIGNDGQHLAAERQAGITTKLFELAWSAYETADGTYSLNYVTSKRAELDALRQAGFSVVLSMGVQYPPGWLLALPDSRYINQYGEIYDDTSPGTGRANVIWNPALRLQMADYIARVFVDFGSAFAAIRVGGGRYGELGYPVASWNGRSNTYWAFDANAARTNPVPGWRPGMASPNGEAGKFLNWYLDRLTEYQNWQIARVRQAFGGPIMVLHPSFGIRPGQAQAAINVNLNGSTSPEINGEIQRGYDYARFVNAVTDQKVWITSTWLESPFGDDAAADCGKGRPIRYLACLADAKGLAKYGENGGRDDIAAMRFTSDQATRFGLQGFLWFNESELLSGQYATLTDYATVIAEGG